MTEKPLRKWYSEMSADEKNLFSAVEQAQMDLQERVQRNHETFTENQLRVWEALKDSALTRRCAELRQHYAAGFSV